MPKAITDVFHNFDGQQLLGVSKEQWIYYLGDSDGSGLFDELRVPYSYDDAASALYGGSFSVGACATIIIFRVSEFSFAQLCYKIAAGTNGKTSRTVS